MGTTTTRKRRGKTGNQKRGVAYLRVSTTADRQELGAEAQRRAIGAWASRAGVEIVAWHVEQISGGAPLDRRLVLLAALADVAALDAGVFVVAKLDRFSRDPVCAALAQAELQRHGSALVCADGNGSGDDPTGRLVRGILLCVAEFEKALIRGRIAAALAVKKSRGELTGKAPYGLTVSADGKTLVRDPAEHATLVAIRGLRARGLTIREVQRESAQRGLLSRAGKPFTLAALHKMLRAAAA